MFKKFLLFVCLSITPAFSSHEDCAENQYFSMSILPNEVVEVVLDKLDLVSLINAGQVERSLYQASHSYGFIKKKFGFFPDDAQDVPHTILDFFNIARWHFMSKQAPCVRLTLESIFEETPVSTQVNYLAMLNSQSNARILNRGVMEFLCLRTTTVSQEKKFLLMARSHQLLQHHHGKHDVLGHISTLLMLHPENLQCLAEHADDFLYDLNNHNFTSMVSSFQNVDPDKMNQVIDYARDQFTTECTGQDKLDIVHEAVTALDARLQVKPRDDPNCLLKVLQFIFR